MTYPHQLHVDRRAPRFRLAETTPAVLQFQDSRLTPGELQVISCTGGLLSLSKTVDQGSVVKLMFQKCYALFRGIISRFGSWRLKRAISAECESHFSPESRFFANYPMTR